MYVILNISIEIWKRFGCSECTVNRYSFQQYDADSAVQTFIAAYNFNKLDSCKKYFPTGVKRSTFIVIEGQQRTSKFS